MPQGSVLGPLLFLAYINDLPSEIRSNMKLFADDATLYFDFDNDNNAEEILNSDLDHIQSWADKWLMKFSPTKTKLMGLSLRRGNFINNIRLNFNDVRLTNVKSYKHLGLILSHKLDWSAHVNSLLESVSKMSDVLKLLKYRIYRKSLETIYFTFIRSKLEYGCQVWDNCSKEDSDILEKFQNSIARIVSGARKGTATQALYDELGWESLKQRRECVKFKNFKNIVERKAPNYLIELLPNTVGQRRALRNPDNFETFSSRTETFRSSFMPASVMLWNNKRNELLRQINYKSCANPLFYHGNRSTSVKLAQLRMECSKLNAHLVKLHVLDSPACSCGFDNEDTNHYLLDCPMYANERNIMLQQITNLGILVITPEVLTKGSEMQDFDTNLLIFDNMFAYIESTGRL